MHVLHAPSFRVWQRRCEAYGDSPLESAPAVGVSLVNDDMSQCGGRDYSYGKGYDRGPLCSCYVFGEPTG